MPSGRFELLCVSDSRRPWAVPSKAVARVLDRSNWRGTTPLDVPAALLGCESASTGGTERVICVATGCSEVPLLGRGRVTTISSLDVELLDLPALVRRAGCHEAIDKLAVDAKARVYLVLLPANLKPIGGSTEPSSKGDDDAHAG